LKLIVKREDLRLPIDGRPQQWNYLSIYDKHNNLLKRSEPHHFETDIIYMEYDGIIYCGKRSGQILIDYKSLINKFDNENIESGKPGELTAQV